MSNKTFDYILNTETVVGNMESIEMDTLSPEMKQGRKVSSFVMKCKLRDTFADRKIQVEAH